MIAKYEFLKDLVTDPSRPVPSVNLMTLLYGSSPDGIGTVLVALK